MVVCLLWVAKILSGRQQHDSLRGGVKHQPNPSPLTRAGLWHFLTRGWARHWLRTLLQSAWASHYTGTIPMSNDGSFFQLQSDKITENVGDRRVLVNGG